MLVALDVSYSDQRPRARAAAVVCREWSDDQWTAEYTSEVDQVAAYVPGSFYQRELPCLLEVLREVREPIDVVLIDGYVQLGQRPGLGLHVWEATGEKFPIVGVAKSSFKDVPSVEVLRGRSLRPLYVTAVGMDEHLAADKVRQMHGEFRVPTILKRVHALTRRKAL